MKKKTEKRPYLVLLEARILWSEEVIATTREEAAQKALCNSRKFPKYENKQLPWEVNDIDEI
jgi:hypothetical protein